MVDLGTIIDQVQRELRSLPSIARILDNPQESQKFPKAWIELEDGSYTKQSAGWIIALHNLQIVVVFKISDMPENWRSFIDIYDEIPTQLEKALEAGRITGTTWGTINYTKDEILWDNNIPCRMARFTLTDLKVTKTI